MENDVYAVFQMKTWQRVHSPVEIFYDIDSARNFINELGKRPECSSLEYKIYKRSKTDWERT